MIEIPLYRAKLIDKDDYIIGSFIQGMQSIIPLDLDYCVKNGKLDINHKEFTKAKVIDLSTLSINFPNLLDSLGNKIFLSLNKNGKGGDLLEGVGQYSTYFTSKKTKFKTFYSTINGFVFYNGRKELSLLHWMAYNNMLGGFEYPGGKTYGDLEVVGIQI